MIGSADRDSVRSRLLQVTEGSHGPLGDEEFNSLALDLFAWQYSSNSIYRRYCEQRGATPGSVDHWLAIPAVPTDAFKAAALFCGDLNEAAGFYETSGTTQGSEARGRHHYRETAVYDAALLASFQRFLLPEGEPLPILSLVPPSSEAPHSSLSHMIDTVCEHWGTEHDVQGLETGLLDLDLIVRTVERAADRREPLMVLGTSFAFVHLHDQLAERGISLRCPDGSRAMDTGGFKGKSREVGRPELYEMIERTLGIPERWIVNEYGMTEMSSQFYDGVAGRAKPLSDRLQHGPTWVRSVAVDPETLKPRGDGELGILRHIDLANLDSVIALQTSDVGRVTDHGIELRGRAAGAEARGCSIAVDDLLDAAGRGR